MADRVRRQRRVRRGTWIGVGLAAVVAVAAVPGLLGVLGTWGPAEYDFGGITCSELHPIFPDFLDGKLDEATANKVAIHIEKCPRCSEMARRMMSNPAACVRSEHHPDCDCGRHGTAGAGAPLATLSFEWFDSSPHPDRELALR